MVSDFFVRDVVDLAIVMVLGFRSRCVLACMKVHRDWMFDLLTVYKSVEEFVALIVIIDKCLKGSRIDVHRDMIEVLTVRVLDGIREDG